MMGVAPGRRCIWHGGLSVGARTVEGRLRLLRNWTRGIPEDELLKRATKQAEAAEKRYQQLRREADRRRPKK